MTETTRRSPINWLAILIIVALLIAVGVLAWPRLSDRFFVEEEIQTAEVDLITVVTTVEASGTVEPRQSAVLYWRTTGAVAEVGVVVGDSVQAGDILMSLDPASTPPNVIAAQAELIAARDGLNMLLQPDMMMSANARSDVANAYMALTQAEQGLTAALDAVFNMPAETDQAVTDARTALNDARADFPLPSASHDAQMLYRAMRMTDIAFAAYEDLQQQYEDSGRDASLQAAVTAAESAYEAALSEEQALASLLDNDIVDAVEAQAQAQTDYDQAVDDFVDAIAGDNAQLFAVNVVTARAKAALAEAALFSSLQRLDSIERGADPADIEAAEARLRAAQATVDLAVLTAPFDGEVLAVYYAPGDIVSQMEPAASLADLSELHITVMVDETEVAQIEEGDPVAVTFTALPDVEVEGSVRSVGRLGQPIQGLVKFPVEVVLEDADVDIPLGATADVSIEVNVESEVLAVPLDALQSDSQGEYVNRVASDGAVERVPVESGAIQGEQVAVRGNLEAGQRVQVNPPDAGGFGN